MKVQVRQRYSQPELIAHYNWTAVVESVKAEVVVLNTNIRMGMDSVLYYIEVGRKEELHHRNQFHKQDSDCIEKNYTVENH
jgi:DhnA family fructose-bisphosphate aldolase class Ia